MKTDVDQKWLSQFRKGYLELCVLVVLRKKKQAYGFELMQLFDSAGLNLNEGTLYPLLNRMHKNGWLDSFWQTPDEGGHPRRFYSLSKAGKKMLPGMLATQTLQQQVLDNLAAVK